LIVKTQDLTRIYQLGTSIISAVNRVNLEIREASFVTILGPSGSGKTTLLNLIGLIDQPTSGKFFFRNQDVSLLTDKERRNIRLHSMGFVFQTFNLLPTLTTVENVELPLALAKISAQLQHKRAIELLTAVDLSHRLHHRPRELSMGEMQRVAIARALANDPCLILADEPTGELDTETGSEIIKLLVDLCQGNKTTVLLTTHDKNIAEVADERYYIQDGKLEYESS
jgi:putative ABC transport system ATP-binding protein